VLAPCFHGLPGSLGLLVGFQEGIQIFLRLMLLVADGVVIGASVLRRWGRLGVRVLRLHAFGLRGFYRLRA